MALHKPTSYVYFVQDDQGRIKIGTATDVDARVRQLQTANSSRLRLLATRLGDHVLERQLHVQFNAHRLRGEWFDSEPVLTYLRGTPINEFEWINPDPDPTSIASESTRLDVETEFREKRGTKQRWSRLQKKHRHLRP